MKPALLIFPHQLFKAHPGVSQNPDMAVLIEDTLFFGDSQYPCQFHKQKLVFHRASMKAYQSFLDRSGIATEYFEYKAGGFKLSKIIALLAGRGCKQITLCDPCDFILEKRLKAAAQANGISLNILPSPAWLNSRSENQDYRSSKSRWFMADFYQFQRKKLGILMDGDQPVGGQWSFDEDNRKKVPKSKLSEIPPLSLPAQADELGEAREYVDAVFPDNPGQIDRAYYPVTHKGAEIWLQDFLKQRFANFGPYEDAIVKGESWLWHSVLTPMLNTGLLTPAQILDAVSDYAQTHNIPIASHEGFVRQIIGWREFMRATYDDIGVQMRTRNHWGHTRKMPACFYTASTGIDPVDDTIERILKTGYCHHIERLMVLGGFMFLCEIDPQEIYRWFMEMFIDSYDWVMVPNVYAMSQNADGGQITTKPYFSGSNYIKKMSHYKHGKWAEIWDGLYWRWIIKNADQLKKNPRWAMMVSMAGRMDEDKKSVHLDHAKNYLNSVFGEI